MYINQCQSQQHFPTPHEVSMRMRSLITQKISRTTTVLDPSAGNGILLEVFDIGSFNLRFDRSQSKRIKSFNLFAIEIDNELRMILNEKGFGVLGTDFLSFNEARTFNIILMNPPFNDGDSHFLKAWDLLAPGGEICCLLNKETIANPYSKERKLLLTIVEDNIGAIENLGQCFKNADRKTDVEVVLVYVQKPIVARSSYSFDSTSFKSESSQFEEFAANSLVQSNAVKALVDRYKAAEKALRDRHKSQSELDFYLNGVSSHGLIEVPYDVRLTVSASFEQELYAVKSMFWGKLFESTEITEKATSAFKNKLREFAVQQVNMAFSYENIRELLIMVLGNQENIQRESIDSVFKKGCDFHPSNRIHWEGWESNSAHKWGKKIVIPNCVTYDSTWDTWGDSYGYNGGSFVRNFLSDLDKVLCWISGSNYEKISKSDILFKSHVNGLNNSKRNGYIVSYDSWVSSHFIRVRFYKKGTIHVQIIDPELLQEFNRRAAQGKPWMPPSRYNPSPQKESLKQLIAA